MGAGIAVVGTLGVGVGTVALVAVALASHNHSDLFMLIAVPGLTQALWVAPVVAWGMRKGLKRTVVGVLIGASVVAGVNAVLLYSLSHMGPFDQ